jgi:hypothetical protein
MSEFFIIHASLCIEVGFLIINADLCILSKVLQSIYLAECADLAVPACIDIIWLIPSIFNGFFPDFNLSFVAGYGANPEQILIDGFFFRR